ncbi:HNH endonuclease [Halovulum sp. GXIMD14794]
MGLVRDYFRHSAKVCGSKRWKGLRWQILRRDGFQCVKCSARGRLEVDHIKPVRDAPELSYEPTNLQTLCKPCHSAKTREELGLSSHTPEQKAWAAFVGELENK